MSFSSWFKNLFSSDTVDLPDELKEELKGEQEVKKDYKLKIFEINHKKDVNNVTNFVLQDNALALIKMNKFTGDHNDLKETLAELKQACDNCNSKVFGVSNNMFLVVKNSVEVLKE